MKFALSLTSLFLLAATGSLCAETNENWIKRINETLKPDTHIVALRDACEVTLISQDLDDSGKVSARHMSVVPLKGIVMEQILDEKLSGDPIPALVQIKVEGNFFTSTNYPIEDTNEYFSNHRRYEELVAENGAKACSEESCIFTQGVYMAALVIQEPFTKSRNEVHRALLTLKESCQRYTE